MQKLFLLKDNRILPLEGHERAISAFNSSFLYGVGLFESFRADGDKVPFLREHLARLIASAQSLEIPIPDKRPLMTLVAALLEQPRTPSTYVKLLLSEDRNEMRLRTTTTARPLVVGYAEPLSPYPPSLYKRGVKVAIIRSVYNDSPPLCHHKTSNYLSKILGRKEATRQGAWEGILVTPGGKVSEGCTSNVFWVKQGTLHTVPVRTGCLPGITRAVITQLARKAKIPFQEKDILPEELMAVDEIILSNSLAGIIPVTVIGHKPIGRGRPGPIFNQLTQLYERHIR